MEVVAQKSQARAAQHQIRQRRRRVPGEQQCARQARRRDQRQPRRQPVHAVNQVECVHRPDNPQHRDQTVQPERKRHNNPAHVHPRRKEDQRHRHLTGQLDHRPHAELVVNQPDHHQQSGCQQEPPLPMDGKLLADRCAHRQHQSPQHHVEGHEDREPAAARHRHLVDAARVRPVHHADFTRRLAQQRRQQQRDRQRAAKGRRILGAIRRDAHDHALRHPDPICDPVDRHSLSLTRPSTTLG